MDKINKNEILKNLKADMKEAERLQREWFIKREEWSSQTEGAPYGNEVEGKSKIVSKDIKKQREWMIPSITDPFLSTSDVIKCNPVTYEDGKAARQNELLLNTQFCRKFNRYNFIMKATKVLVTEGSVVIQTGWDYEEEEFEAEVEIVKVDENGREYIDTEISMQTNVIRNQPTAIVCRNEDIFIDPTCMDDMDKCQFVIHRYESSLNALKQDGRYENLDKVEAAQYNLTNDPQYLREDQTYFEFKDKPRKKFVVHEYWGNYDVDGDGIAEPIVCAWVGNTLIRLESNPYPDKKPPFVIVPFSAVPFHMFGEALAETIGDNQKIKTAITRGMVDNMAKSNNAVVATRKGALDPVNRKKFLKGENFEFNGTPGDFWQGSYNQLPSSAFDMLNLQNNEIESQTGVKSFSGGISGNALGSTATGARGALDATATRRLNLVRNMSENMIKPIMRKWMAYNAEFLEEEEVIRITNDEYVPIRRDDLAGKIDIDISISTSEDNAAKSQELSFLLQTVGPNEDPAIRREIMAQIMDLMRMPEQAKKIRDYQPQPDPVQQKMQELQIAKLEAEIEKIRADAANKLASSVENEADRDEKLAQAELKRAQARKLMSEADNLDLDFLKKDEMVDEQTANERDQMQYDRKMQEKQFDRLHTLEVMQAQINAKDTNIGVK